MANNNISFRYNFQKFIATVAYLANGSNYMDKLKTLKLFYYADKWHLQKYGRPIIGDQYFRLDLGPVGSVSKDILDEAEELLDYEGIEMKSRDHFLTFFTIDPTFTYPRYSIKQQPDFEVLSKSEIEVLDRVVAEHGNKTGLQLMNETHEEAPWKQTPRYERIDYRLFLEEIPEDERNAMIDFLEETQEDRDLLPAT